MQVSVEATGKLGRQLKVEVPEERIASEVETRLKKLSRTTRIKGFRPGKAPFKVIRQRYGSQVRQEVVGEVVQSTFFEAIQQENLKPAGTPRIDPLDDEQGKGLSYTASFEVMPELALKPVEQLEVEKTVCEVNDEDVDTMIEVLRKQRKELKETDRAAEDGDTVEIDFQGTIDGEPFEGGSGEDSRLELGSGRFIDGFEEGLQGQTPGSEVTLDLVFPGDYPNEQLAGKPVRFKVTVKKVYEPRLPELNDEFFAQFGVEEGGEEAFRKEIRAHMEREAATAMRNRQRDAVVDALYKANEIDIPHTLIHEEAHRLQQQFEQQLKAYGIADEAQIPNDLSMFEEQARKRVATQLILMDIIRDQGFKADSDKVRAKVEANAENYEDPSAVINWYYGDKQRLAEVEAAVLEDQVIDWVNENAGVKEVNVTFDELMNKGQTDAD